ncbi:MAG TPA: SH3 domain-containing protein [Tepidisphaeraceae bacterium]|nr:SH3 domain-containing protein [Tepidisphaeraceae bacterium]
MIRSHRAISPALRRTFATAVVVVIAGISIADSVKIQQSVEIHAKAGILLDDPLETVPADTQLQVVGVDQGFYKVKTPKGTVGYVQRDDLPANYDLSKATANANTSGLSTSAASKDVLENDALRYAQTNNLNPKPLDNLLTQEKLITTKELREFDAQGHVGVMGK